ncbi:hypothetical protein BT67DRAFT_438052 [Trichocladium antarcticum]|uniref:Prokaryotic-type class I peptide chain release factors domain-containing protein n=1 Tax=Trichocladium antarcticum TaxID=1450529 RepID=A0AAN6ZGX7_9PEZI|nr:hypothetical protein BT67DRAFT_438052 [Trichocladium antarcticum]
MLRPLTRLTVSLRLARAPTHAHHGFPAAAAAPFTTTTAAPLKQMPPRPKPPPESDLEESFLKGSGPGGQKINKTSSAVQIKHIPTGIVIKSQATRSRSENRKIARSLLALRLDELANGDQSRTAIVGGAKKKRSDSAAKKSRRKYKKLAEEAAEATGKETTLKQAEEVDVEEGKAAEQEAAERVMQSETGNNTNAQK